MPHLAWWRDCELNESTHFLGICEYTKREKFEVKVRALCVAMEWDFGQIRMVHCYSNSILNKF